MATRPKSRFWRICRIYFRRFRISVWLAVLALLAGFVYLNQVGLPGFVKKPLLENLRARGLDLEFSRLRLRWYGGLVADNVRFERTDERLSPQFTIQEVQVRLNLRALVRRQLQIDSLVLRQGRLVWPLAETNQGPRELAIENIQTDLRFSPEDEWTLNHLTAKFAGAKLRLSGTVAHGSAVRDWKFFQAALPAPARAWQDHLRQLADLLERIHFSTPPELVLDVQGDARDLQSFTVRMVATAPGADTPWGTFQRGRLVLRLYPVSTNGPSRADLNLEADEAQTRWGTTANVQLNAHLALAAGQTKVANGDLTLCAGQVKSQWGSATNLQLTLQAASDAVQTNLVNAELILSAAQVESRWGRAANARFNAQWAHALTNAIPLAVAAAVTAVAAGGDPPILAPAAGVYTFAGLGFVSGRTAVLLETVPLAESAGAPAAGEFQISGGGTSIAFRAPAFLGPGRYGVRVRVSGIESPPSWWIEL